MAAAAVQRPGAPPPPAQRYQGVQKESAGYRLMSAMGWREGEGLGASKQGIKVHIKVKKKFENWGVGAVEAAEHAQNWTNGMLDFHRVLSNLSEVVSEHARRAASSDGDDASDSENSIDASGGEEEQKRQKPKQRHKGKQKTAADSKKRKQAAPPSSNGGSGSSSSSSGEEAEVGEEAMAAPKRVRAATHLGRFKKREAAKMVKGYSQHDLAAIIGVDPFAATAAAVPEVRVQPAREASSSGYDSDTKPSDNDGAVANLLQQPAAVGIAAQQQGKAKPKPEMIVVRRPMMSSGPAVQPSTPPKSRQADWWHVCFHRAAGPRRPPGAAASGPHDASAAVTDEPAFVNVHGFSEQDQTNLYNLAHDKATQGRVGLGRSSMPKKVAGARWVGKKTQIVDSEEEEEQQQQDDGQEQQGAEVGPAPDGVELEQEEGLVIILPPSKRHLLDHLGSSQQQAAAADPTQQRQQQQQPAEGQPGAPASGKRAKKVGKAAAAAEAAEAGKKAGPNPGLGCIKWKTAVAVALKASSKGRLKLSKLHKVVVKDQGVPKVQHGVALDALTAFLQQTPKFELKHGVVRAAA